MNEVALLLSKHAAPEVALVGDSHTDNGTPWGLRLHHNPLRVVSISRGGFMARQLFQYAKQAADSGAPIISVMAGTNDVHDRHFDVDESAEDIAHLVDLASAHGAKVITTLAPPAADPDLSARVRALDDAVVAKLKGRDVTVIDLWPDLAKDGRIKPELTVDGVHLSPAGYTIWQHALRTEIERIEAST